MSRASFSLLRRGSPVPDNQPLVRSSVLIFFEIKGNGIRFPIHAFIVNLVLSVLVLCVLIYFLLESTVISPLKPYSFSGKLYCLAFIEGSLSIELNAQLIHVGGSALLIIGAIKRCKILCYAYEACSMLPFLISTIIRAAQFFLCEKKQHPKMLPLKYGPELPEYFKLTLMWLICQLFWYWLVFSFVVAQLEWFNVLQVEDEMASNLPNTSRERLSK